MRRSILSVGIDIGTTTTQLVLSRLEMADISSAFSVTKIEIVGTSIVHRGTVRFTPLLPNGSIDAEALEKMVEEEYAAVGVRPGEVEAGAVIVTGESAGRDNAREIAHKLSRWAGDFVATTAGADLEAVLAGQGAGAAEHSRTEGIACLNLDIGGGTTNAGLFRHGRCADAWAMDIGGRLVKIASDGTLAEISDRIRLLALACGLDTQTGSPIDLAALRRLCREMAEALVDATLGRPGTPLRRTLFIDHPSQDFAASSVGISGGVGACLFEAAPASSLKDISRFGDIGPLLAQEVRAAFAAAGVNLTRPDETLRATVIGAGSHAVRLSGSTVTCGSDALPLHDVPIARLFAPGEPEDFAQVATRMDRRQRLHGTPAAFYLEGKASMSWKDISVLADEVAGYYRDRPGPVLFLVRHDFARALGQGIAARGAPACGVVCLDGICMDDGDYIDIGSPLGDVVPVVVKTLVFRSGTEKGTT